MNDYMVNTVIPGLFTGLFILIFFGIYQIYDFPVILFRDVLKIKGDLGLFLHIVIFPALIGIGVSIFFTTNFAIETPFGRVLLDPLHGLILGYMFSLAFRASTLRKKIWESKPY